MLTFLRNRGEARDAFGVCFGKLAACADFIRPHRHAAVVERFDGWLQRAHRSLQRREEWMPAYDGSAPVEFVFHDQQERIVGVFHPSRDAAGRRYPLVAARVERREAAGGVEPGEHVLMPMAGEALSEALLPDLQRAMSQPGGKEKLRELRRMGDQLAPDQTLARQLHRQFISATPLHALFSLLERERPGTDCQRFFINLIYLAHFGRQFGGVTLDQVLRLPLPTESGQQRPYACFWLHLISILVGERNVGGYLMRREPGHAVLVAGVGALPEQSLWALLSSGSEPDCVADFAGGDEHWRSHAAYAGIAYALSRVCANPESPLSVLLAFAREIGAGLHQDRRR